MLLLPYLQYWITYKAISKCFVKLAHVKIHHLIYFSPDFGLFWIDRFVFGISVGKICSNCPTLIHMKVSVHEARNVVLRVDLEPFNNNMSIWFSYHLNQIYIYISIHLFICTSLTARYSGFKCSPVIRFTTMNSYSTPSTSQVIITNLTGADISIPYTLTAIFTKLKWRVDWKIEGIWL